MARYIDADKADVERISCFYGAECRIEDVKEWLDEQPTADVAEVKRGYWKDTEYGVCSVCNRSISEIYDADSCMAYGILDELIACPFCGARMDGAAE